MDTNTSHITFKCHFAYCQVHSIPLACNVVELENQFIVHHLQVSPNHPCATSSTFLCDKSLKFVHPKQAAERITNPFIYPVTWSHCRATYVIGCAHCKKKVGSCIGKLTCSASHSVDCTYSCNLANHSNLQIFTIPPKKLASRISSCWKRLPSQGLQRPKNKTGRSATNGSQDGITWELWYHRINLPICHQVHQQSQSIRFALLQWGCWQLPNLLSNLQIHNIQRHLWCLMKEKIEKELIYT